MTRCGLLLVATGLFVTAAGTTDEGKDLKKLEGTWVLTAGEEDGKMLPAEDLKDARLTVEGNKHAVKAGDTTYRGTHKLNPTKKPKTIDIADTEGPFKGRSVLGIYDLDGDTFKICYALPGKGRPKDFSAKEGTGYRYHVWKREKK
jgi:uncharacterized protein (TIGR03067 family)